MIIPNIKFCGNGVRQSYYMPPRMESSRRRLNNNPLMEGVQRYSTPYHYYRKCRRRESLPLFSANLFPEDNNEDVDSSTTTIVVMPPTPNDATRLITNDAKLLSNTRGDGDDVFVENNNNGGKELSLMDPMEDFVKEKAKIMRGFDETDSTNNEYYKRGLLTIGFITFLFATNSPVLHWAFTSGDNPPPVLLVNAAVSMVALVGLLLGGDTLEGTGGSSLPSRDNNNRSSDNKNSNTVWVGGLELGIWKFLGTTSNLYGLALTTASHGALLIQLTTLIVPITRALVYKESISTKLKLSIGLALSGVVCFATDPTGTPSLLGDGFCVMAAICYSAYDIRLYEYGKIVNTVKPLITTKIATQALFSILSLLFLAPFSLGEEGITTSMTTSSSASDYLQTLVTTFSSASSEWGFPVMAAILWSGVAVNAVAPFLQVGGQQIVGPTKCQTIYASQPLWAAVLSFIFLGEQLGLSGVVGGTAFLLALTLAATADSSVVAEEEKTKT